MFKNLEKLISFIFKSLRWLLMLGFFVVVYIVGKSLFMTSEAMDEAYKPTYKPKTEIVVSKTEDKVVKKVITKKDNCRYYKSKMREHSKEMMSNIKYTTVSKLNGKDLKEQTELCNNFNLYKNKFLEDKCVSEERIDDVVQTTHKDKFIKDNDFSWACPNKKE